MIRKKIFILSILECIHPYFDSMWFASYGNYESHIRQQLSIFFPPSPKSRKWQPVHPWPFAVFSNSSNCTRLWSGIKITKAFACDIKVPEIQDILKNALVISLTGTHTFTKRFVPNLFIKGVFGICWHWLKLRIFVEITTTDGTLRDIQSQQPWLSVDKCTIDCEY